MCGHTSLSHHDEDLSLFFFPVVLHVQIMPVLVIWENHKIVVVWRRKKDLFKTLATGIHNQPKMESAVLLMMDSPCSPGTENAAEMISDGAELGSA